MSQSNWISKVSAVAEVFGIDASHVVSMVVTGNYAEFTLRVNGKYTLERFYRIEPKE